MAASSSITTFNYSPAGLPIFEGENYHFWSTQMRTFFISEDLWDLVENSYESSQSQEEYSAWSEARKEKLKEHKMKDAKALYYIQQAITKTIAPRIMDATKSKEAWEILKNEFQRSEKAIVAKRQTLWREFDNLMMEEGESIEIFFSRVFTVINQLKGCGGIIRDKRAVEKVLRSLPIKYDRVVAGIKESTNLSTLTLHELMGSLQVDESEEAIVAKRQTLWREFDNLMMEEGESIEIFFSRVFTVINQLKGCGGIIRDKRAVEKVLRSLPIKYDRVVAGIKESTNFSTLTLHELMGSLQVDEERMDRFSHHLLEQSFQTKMNMSEKTDGGNKKQNQGGQFQRGRSNHGHGRGGKVHTQRTARDISQSESCCKFCKNTNHGSMDCSFKKPTRFKNNNHLEKDSWFRNKDEANFSEKGESSNQQFYPYMNSQQEPQDTRDIDSRCSNHMMGNNSSFVSLDDGKFQNIKGKSTIAVQTEGAMEASTSSEVNFQIPASSGIPLSVPSVVEGESAISGFTSSFQSEAGSKVGSLPLISSPDGLGKLQSVEGMTIQKSFELMDNVKPIQNVVKALATNDELRNAFLKVKEVQEFTRRLNTGDND